MEIVLRDGKNELCIDHDSGSVGFTVLLHDNSQLNFNVESDDWERLVGFIGDQIYHYNESLKD